MEPPVAALRLHGERVCVYERESRQSRVFLDYFVISVVEKLTSFYFGFEQRELHSVCAMEDQGAVCLLCFIALN